MMWPGQDPGVMVSGMREILGIMPANAGRNQTGSVQSRAEGGGRWGPQGSRYPAWPG